MEMLNKASETVLRYLIELSRGCENVDLRVVRNAFADDPSVQTDTVLTNLQNAGMLNLHTNDAMTIGKITLTSTGKLYFANKEEFLAQNTPAPSQVFNITNSSNFTAANNGSLNISNSCGVDFSEARRFIEENIKENKEAYEQLLSILQDSLQNNKPLPRGKLQKFANVFSKVASHLQPFALIAFKQILNFLCANSGNLTD